MSASVLRAVRCLCSRWSVDTICVYGKVGLHTRYRWSIRIESSTKYWLLQAASERLDQRQESAVTCWLADHLPSTVDHFYKVFQIKFPLFTSSLLSTKSYFTRWRLVMIYRKRICKLSELHHSWETQSELSQKLPSHPQRNQLASCDAAAATTYSLRVCWPIFLHFIADNVLR